MKELLAAIVLLCLSTSVLAHDIYSNLRDRAGHLCCNGQDCRPVEATVLPDGNYYLPGSDEVIPAELATPSPDDRFHHCSYIDRWSGPVLESKPMTSCSCAPLHASYSAQAAPRPGIAGAIAQIGTQLPARVSHCRIPGVC